MNNTKGIVRVRCISKLELRFTDTVHYVGKTGLIVFYS